VPTYAESAYIGRPSHGIAPPWPGVTFRPGDCARALRDWQLQMNNHGFDFQGTGCFFAETRMAARALQRANGIPESGVIGPLTWMAAWTATSP
jgi:hypothetical protein